MLNLDVLVGWIGYSSSYFLDVPKVIGFIHTIHSFKIFIFIAEWLRRLCPSKGLPSFGIVFHPHPLMSKYVYTKCSLK